MNNYRHVQASGVLISILATILGSCQAPDNKTVIAGQTEIIVDDPNNPDQNVCDPLGNGNTVSPNQGLYGQLYYQNPNEPPLTSALSYPTSAHPAGLHLFFSELNVPTRMFNQGFYTQSGQLLQNGQGNTLYEFFGLHFKSKIVLTPNDAPGLYQFAVLSDDGSVINFDFGNGYETHIDNDGVHPSRFRCAQSFVAMNAASALPTEVFYYQGPKFHISMILLWREVTPEMLASPNPYAHPVCEVTSNTAFFNANDPLSPPTQDWIDQVLGTGWKVLAPGNFKLPDSAPPNPCNNGGCTGLNCSGGGV